jgi:hypothetical protein
MFKTEAEYKEFVKNHERFCEYAEEKWAEYIKIKYPNTPSELFRYPEAFIEDGNVYIRWNDGYEDTSDELPKESLYDDNWKEMVARQIEEEKEAKKIKEESDRKDKQAWLEHQEYEQYKRLREKFEKVV